MTSPPAGSRSAKRPPTRPAERAVVGRRCAPARPSTLWPPNTVQSGDDALMHANVGPGAKQMAVIGPVANSPPRGGGRIGHRDQVWQ